MTSLILGMGQIGVAVAQLLERNDSVYTHDITDTEFFNDFNTDVLHVCFPYSETFVEDVKSYIKEFKPSHVVVWATVPIGTTKQIKGAVHSPVEGRHPELALSVRSMTRWIGANNKVESEFFAQYFKELYLQTHVVESSDFTEALKLLSTTEYGVNIEFARYKKRVADELGMNYKLTKLWNMDYNRLYHNLSMPWAQKFVLEAPEGPKGGHCVTPNARLLQEQFPDDLVKIVGEL